MGRQSRQVSCRFCRERKLKCNRLFPCSNCTSRGVPCPSAQQQIAPRAPTEPPPQTPAGNNSEILSRLARLESLLASQQAQAPLSPATPPMGGPASAPLPLPNNDLSASHLQRPLPGNLQTLVEDAVSIHRRCPGLVHNLTQNNSLVVRICPLRLFTEILPDGLNGSQTLQPPSLKKVWLPDRQECSILVNKYLADVSFVHHIVHAPSVWKIVDEVYASLESGEAHIPTGHLLLILAIFGIVTHVWTSCRKEEIALFPNPRDANSQASSWMKVAFEVLESTQTNAAPSLEYVQGLTIMALTILNMEGASPKGQSLLWRATAMSRELGLHRLDHRRQGIPSMDFPPLTAVRAEVGRRIWWYLTSADWLLSSTTNAQRGTYTIHPLQMVVHKPMNINDEDMSESAMTLKPNSVPTIMSYSLQRIQLAEEIRTLADRYPLVGFDPYAVGYSHVMEADAGIERILQNVPPFFQEQANAMDMEDATLNENHPDSLLFQKHLLHVAVYGQRMKLHIPYLARGAVEAAFGHSHRISVQSAWKVINSEYQLQRENRPSLSSRFKWGTVIYGYFLAISVLVLDLCLITDEGEKLAKKRELKPAWAILLEAQTEASLLAPPIELLIRIMQKHNIDIDKEETGSERQENTAPPCHSDPMPVEGFVGRVAGPESWDSQMLQSAAAQMGENGLMRDQEDVDVYYNMLWLLEKPFI